jgi:hypothetical protein
MATEAMHITNLTFHSADISDRRATMILSAQNIVENGMIPKLIQKNGPPDCGIYTLGQ